MQQRFDAAEGVLARDVRKALTEPRRTGAIEEQVSPLHIHEKARRRQDLLMPAAN